ncbi:MAG: glycosyl hydrolase family protein, partial [Moraxellaceae bacterium]
TKFTDWHTYTIEWSPGRVKFILDNTVVLNSTNWVPSGPMRWQLQTETKGNGSSSGNLMVDWVSVWSYRP